MKKSEREGLGPAKDPRPERLAHTQVASMDQPRNRDFLALSVLERQLYAAGISAREDFLEAQGPNSRLLQLVPV